MDLIQYLGRLHDECLKFLPQIKFNKHNTFDFTLLPLYCSLIELAGNILILMSNRGRLSVPIVLRTFLETYVEFYNLVQNPEYVHNIDANEAKEMFRILKVARDTNNPYLSDIANLQDLPKRITEAENKLRDLKTRGFEPLSIHKRFERAGMSKEYEGLYGYLCTEAHSNKISLVSRHTEIVNEDDFKLVSYKDDPDEAYIPYLDTVASLLLSSTMDIHKKLKSDAFEEMSSLHSEFETIRATYPTRT